MTPIALVPEAAQSWRPNTPRPPDAPAKLKETGVATVYTPKDFELGAKGVINRKDFTCWEQGLLRSGETSFEYERTIQPRPKLGRWTAELNRMMSDVSRQDNLAELSDFDRLWPKRRNRPPFLGVGFLQTAAPSRRAKCG
jgi:hypothetical protein